MRAVCFKKSTKMYFLKVNHGLFIVLIMNKRITLLKMNPEIHCQNKLIE